MKNNTKFVLLAVTGMLWGVPASIFAAAPPPQINPDPGTAPCWRGKATAMQQSWLWYSLTAATVSPTVNTGPAGSSLSYVIGTFGAGRTAFSKGFTNDTAAANPLAGTLSVSNVWDCGGDNAYAQVTVAQPTVARAAYKYVRLEYIAQDATAGTVGTPVRVMPADAVQVGSETLVDTGASTSTHKHWRVSQTLWKMPVGRATEVLQVTNANDLETLKLQAFVVDTLFVVPPVRANVGPVDADAGQNYATVTYAGLGPVDSCIFPTPNESCTPPSGSHFPAGQTTPVLCSVTDVYGNAAPYSFTVTVNVVGPAGYPPVVVGDVMGTVVNQAQTIDAAKLLLNDTDTNLPPALPLSVVSVGGADGGGAVSLLAGVVTYTPPASTVGTFHFTYTAQNTLGLSAVGTVTVTVSAGGQVTQNIVGNPVRNGNTVTVTARGIPLAQYILQRTTGSLSSDSVWTDVAGSAATASSTGLLTLVDAAAPPESGGLFYRTKFVGPPVGP